MTPGRSDRRLGELHQDRRAAANRLKAVEQRIAALASPGLVRLDAALKALRAELTEAPRFKGKTPSPSNGYHSAIHATPDATAWVQVDLGRSVPIEEVRLVPARPVDFPDTPGFGFPVRFRVEVSDDPAFAQGRTMSVAEDERPDAPDIEDEPYVIHADGRTARFVRVTATRLWKRTNDYVFALSELEVISEGENVARGAAGLRAGFDRGGLVGPRAPGGRLR